MKRIGLLTAGGDTPALNATIYGAVERANELGVEVVGFLNGFAGLLDPSMPHVILNPLLTTIPELDPKRGGTILGSSRTYVDPEQPEVAKQVAARLERMKLHGLICVGGDGTLNGMQALANFFPCVLAPKTIDNDLGLNYLDEPNEWIREEAPDGTPRYRRQILHETVNLEEIVNYTTPGYATAVFVATDAIRRIRTTAESHRRIAVVEVMGRDSGYIALGAAYGQPDLILIPEVPLDMNRITARIRELYELQEHVVVVIGEGVVDESGQRLGAITKSVDPAGKFVYRGAAEEFKRRLSSALGEAFFAKRLAHESPDSVIFTRKVGHTQRGGRPIRFDHFYASQLGGKAVELLLENKNNSVATLQWSCQRGFYVDSLSANKLRDRWQVVHARRVHPSFYDAERYRPSPLGISYLLPIFNNALGTDDLELLRSDLFDAGNLTTTYQSVTVDILKRVRRFDAQ